MAQLIMCDVCNETPAAILVTILDGGDVTGMCGMCAPPNLRTIADLMQGIPVGEPAHEPGPAVSEEVDAAADAGAVEPEPKRRRGQTAAAAPAPAAEPQTEPSPAAHPG